MDKWECSVCGYIYDPAENDGVAFEALPDSWFCPNCGVGKEFFNKIQ
jgi:rubredoxin